MTDATPERWQRMEAERLARWLGYAALGVIGWSFFLGWPRDALAMAQVGLVLFSLALLVARRAFFTAGLFAGEERATLAVPFLLPGVGLYFLAKEMPLLTPGRPLYLAAGAGVLVAAVAWLVDGAARKRPWVAPIYAVFLALSGGSAAAVANVSLDDSQPVTYRASVIRQYSDRAGKGWGSEHTYTLEVTPWGPCAQKCSVEVDSLTYRRADVGGEIQIHVRAGRLGMPWYEVSAR